MLKLKDLFDNRDLAIMILKNWDFNEQKLELLDNFRISANAVYVFEHGEKICFLRFAPISDRSKETILAEIEFLEYLRDKGYPAVQTLKSKNNNEVELVSTPWGDYVAAAFLEVQGKQLGQVEVTEQIIINMGKELARLHELSSNYTPKQNKRNSWLDQMDWMESVLINYDNQQKAMEELRILKKFFSSLPESNDVYGLIHFDFELDNVFYNETNESFHIIDFDDSVYHWYAMDINQSIKSLEDDLPEEMQAKSRKLFLEGYQRVRLLQADMLDLLPVFNRYAYLYGYVRCLRSVSKKWNNEPEWMESLRSHLAKSMNRRSIDFGKPIVIDNK